MRTILSVLCSICVLGAPLIEAAPLSTAEQFFVLKQTKAKNEKDTDGDGRPDSRDAFPYDRAEWLDTDRDGTGNNADLDDDNDKVQDAEDAFPLDRTEWLDTDQDGTGNNADQDDDNDSIPDKLDLWPTDATESQDQDKDGIGDNRDQFDNDAFCWRSEDGDNNGCLLSQLKDLQRTQVASDGNQTLVFMDKRNQQVYRFDVKSRTITLRQYIPDLGTIGDNHLLYQRQHQKFYFLTSDGLKLYHLTAQGATAVLLIETPDRGAYLHDVGNFLAVEQVKGSTYGGRSLMLNANTEKVALPYTDFGRVSAFDPVQQRIYYFRQRGSEVEAIGTQINPTTAELSDSKSHYSFDNDPTAGPIRLSADGLRLLLSPADVYRTSDFVFQQTLSGSHLDAQFTASGDVVRLRQQYINDTSYSELIRQNASGQPQESTNWQGVPLALMAAGQDFVTLYKTNAQLLHMHIYRPSDDVDGDGVPNAQDDFPRDPAAALDTDHDGTPDSWLAGKTAADSNNRLKLDAFPQDSACQLSTHANSGGQCDITARMPAQLAMSSFFDDAKGTIYLYRAADRRIYRWSALQQSWLNPLVIQGDRIHSNINAPLKLSFHPQHQRIYLAYDDGRIHALDLKTGRESYFAGTPRAANIHAAGNFLVAQDNPSNSSFSTHYIFNIIGFKTDQRSGLNQLKTLVWHPGLTRYFHTTPDVNLFDIAWTELQAQGLIPDNGDSPFHGNMAQFNQLYISADYQFLLADNGKIFESHSLELANKGLTVSRFDTANWHAKQLLVGNLTDVYGYNSSTRVEEFRLKMTGNVLHIATTEHQAIVVLQHGNGVQFYPLQLGDQDNDRLPDRWEQQFGFDYQNPADATTDVDSDGLTQLQEFSHKTDPRKADSDNDGLNDGVEVNTHRTSPLDADSDRDGLSDGAEVLQHRSNPLAADSDNDGLNDKLEVEKYQTNPNSADTDGDGLTDKWEVEKGTDAKVADASADPDNDGLNNQQELQQQTLPTVADTDHDGLNDGAEVNAYQTDPRRSDTDNDQLPDGWEAQTRTNPKLDDSDADPDQDHFTNLEEYAYQSLPQDVLSRPLAQPWRTVLGDEQQRAVQPVKRNTLNLSLIWQVNHQFSSIQPPVHSADTLNLVSTSEGHASIDMAARETMRQELYGYGVRYRTVNEQFLVSTDDNFLRTYAVRNGDLVHKSPIDGLDSYSKDMLAGGDRLYWTHDAGAYSFNTQNNQLSAPTPLFPPTSEVLRLGYNQLSRRDNLLVVRGETKLITKDTETGKVMKTWSLPDCIQGDRQSTPANLSVNPQVFYAQLGLANDAYTLGRSCIVGYSFDKDQPRWEVAGSTAGQLAVLPDKLVAVLNHTQLSLLDLRNGAVLRSWQTPNRKAIVFGPIATLSHVFVGTDTDTYALDLETLTVRWQHAVSGFLTLQPNHTLYVTNAQQVSMFAPETDTDLDGMPDWWEQHYQLQSGQAADADGDNDADGLTNLAEFQAGSMPDRADTDGDTLTDLAEVQTHRTHPAKVDTDADGLTDPDEVHRYHTKPSDPDSDADGYNDGLEIRHRTDPLSAAEKPAPWTDVTESFEDPGTLDLGWTLGLFKPDQRSAQHGSYALRSPPLAPNKQVTLKLQREFAKGTLSFYARLDAQNYDVMSITVDGRHLYSTSYSEWGLYNLPIDAGHHTIEWIFSKHNNTNIEDSLYIDNIRFTAD